MPKRMVALLATTCVVALGACDERALAPELKPAYAAGDPKNACKDGGYLFYRREDGKPFKNQGDCVSYVNQGGKLVSPAVSQITNVSGEPGTVKPGDSRTVRARLLSVEGAPIPNAPVIWNVVSGGGTLASLTGTTDASGVAQNTWKIGSATGGQRVSITPGWTSTARLDFVALVRNADGTISITPQLETTRAVTVSISDEGGTVSATGSNSVTYRLIVPRHGLMDPVAVTLTPIAGVPDAPIPGGATFGVHFSPEGTQFTAPARLEVVMPAPAKGLGGFAYTGAGNRFHLEPAAINGNTLTFTITHFSGVGGGPTGPQPAPFGPLQGIPAVTSEETAMQALAIAEEQARFRQSMGQPDNFAAEAAAILVQWYDAAIRDELERAGLIEGVVDGAVARFQRWQSFIQRIGSSTELETRTAGGRALLVAAFRLNINASIDRCKAHRLKSEGATALRYAAQATALGLNQPGNGLNESDAQRCVIAAMIADTLRGGQPGAPRRPGLEPSRSVQLMYSPVLRYQPPVTPAPAPEADAPHHGPAVHELDILAESAALEDAVPFFVTAQTQGTLSDGISTFTTAPGGTADVTLTPAPGATNVTVTLTACIRDPQYPRLDNTCGQLVDVIPVQASVFEGNFTIRDNTDALRLIGFTEVTGDLTIEATSSALSLAPLSSLTRVGGVLTIGGDLASLAGLNRLRRVGTLNVNRARLLSSLAGLDSLTQVDEFISVFWNEQLRRLDGIHNVRQMNGLGLVSIMLNPLLTDVSALRGLVPQIRALGIYANDVLADLAPLAGITHLPAGFSINGPAITSVAPFASIQSIGQMFMLGPDDLPKVATFSLPALASAPAGLLLSTQSANQSALSKVSFPALVSTASVQITGDMTDAYLLTVDLPALKQVAGVDVTNVGGSTSMTVNIPVINNPNAVIRINNVQSVPVMTIGTVGTVDISLGAYSDAPRGILLNPLPGQRDLTRISIVSTENLNIVGAENYSAFGPAVTNVTWINLSNVEVGNGLTNIGKVCGWINSTNAVRAPLDHRRIGTVRVFEGAVSGRNFAQSATLVCAGQ